MDSLIIIVLLVVVVWLAFALPARRRQRSHQAMQDSVSVGDEIITAGGLHAVVREADERELRVEIAPGVVATLDRRAVAAVAVDVEPEEDLEGEEGAVNDEASETADAAPEPS
jgi:preprotein translocase subunit YajC